MFLNQQSHSLETFEVMSRSKRRLTDSAKTKMQQYLLSQAGRDGGFFNRRQETDLYYTLFGLFCSLILDVDLAWDSQEKYLNNFEVEALSLVDLSCLLKSHILLKGRKGLTLTKKEIEAFVLSIHKFQTNNGSFSYDGQGQGFPYAVFLALNFYQDLGIDVPNNQQLLKAMENYRTSQGAYHHPQGANQGMLLSTVAAIHNIRYLTKKIDLKALHWIMCQYQTCGGFSCSPGSQLPDLLSTAVSLFTLSVCKQPMESLTSAYQFIDDHWDESGGFRATLLDDICDCEYTYYGLLSLGALDDNDSK